MPEAIKSRLRRVLAAREEKGLLRELRSPELSASDFSSNDYLGFAKQGPFQSFLRDTGHLTSVRSSGSTGSRLLSGHSERTAKLERVAAEFHKSEASLLFNSGYDANLSLLSCLPSSNDAIIYDELIHASIHDGIRAGRARNNAIRFSHNDVQSLQKAITAATRKHPGNVLICIETVYSMDGDMAPLTEILQTATSESNKHARDIYVVADEAHAGGIYGPHGEGRVVELNLHTHPQLLARVVTFGKAFAAHGAVILGSQLLTQYLTNYARPLIYSTALPPHSVEVLHAAYLFARGTQAQKARETLWQRVKLFRRVCAQRLPLGVVRETGGRSAIQAILVPGNRECVEFAKLLRRRGFDVYAVRSPTVPKGAERIRIVIHAHNGEEEIRGLVEAIERLWVRGYSRI